MRGMLGAQASISARPVMKTRRTISGSFTMSTRWEMALKGIGVT